MADTKTTALSAFTPVLTDLGYGVDDPGGTPISGKFTFADARTLIEANLVQPIITVAAANTSALTSTGYSLTGTDATSMVDLAGTWNTTGTPSAIKLNVTDTASNAASKLMDLQVGGVSQFSVPKDALSPVRSTGGFMSAQSGMKFYGSGFRPQIQYNNSSRVHFGDGGLVLNPAIGMQWASATRTDDLAWSVDLSLYRDAANTLAQRNGTTGQENRVWNTWTNASNGEYGGFKWNTNVLEIGSVALGTGTLRGIKFGISGNSIGFVGATPVAQQATTGTVTGFTAGSGTAANDDSTFTGNSGTAAYTVGDIVLALKNYGLLAAS